jgi:hypothetical protein
MALALLAVPTTSFSPVHLRALGHAVARGARPATALAMAKLDYKDPIVAEELKKTEGVDIDDLEEQLAGMGMKVSASMNLMDMRLMMAEVTLRKTGRMPGEKKVVAPKKTSFANAFEKALYEKPAFQALYKKYKTMGINNVNVMTEYINNPTLAKTRYELNYKQLFAEVDAALAAKVEVVATPRVQFAGFPANVGEKGVQFELGAAGKLVKFTCELSEDELTLEGTAEFENAEVAKKVIEKWDGKSMGRGPKLSVTPF